MCLVCKSTHCTMSKMRACEKIKKEMKLKMKKGRRDKSEGRSAALVLGSAREPPTEPQIPRTSFENRRLESLIHRSRLVVLAHHGASYHQPGRCTSLLPNPPQASINTTQLTGARVFGRAVAEAFVSSKYTPSHHLQLTHLPATNKPAHPKYIPQTTSPPFHP